MLNEEKDILKIIRKFWVIPDPPLTAAPDSLPPPSPLSFLCISNKRAILRNYQRLLQPALQKMLSGKEEEREKKKEKTLLDAIHIWARATNNSGR